MKQKLEKVTRDIQPRTRAEDCSRRKAQLVQKKNLLRRDSLLQ